MEVESSFFKQWFAAQPAPSPEETSEKPVASFGHEMNSSEVGRAIAELPKIFRVVDDYFFPVLELFTDEKNPLGVEHFAQEQQSLKGAVRDELERQGVSEALISVSMALLDIPAVIVSQAKANRRKQEFPSVQFHQLPEADRQAVFLLSSWQQHIADYFIAFNEQKLSPQQSSDVYQRLQRQWLDYTNDCKAVIKKLIPDLTDNEYREAVNFNGYKQGIWGTVGVALELFQQGYKLRWSDPETDVLRKIDMLATRKDDETLYAISIKGWSNIEDHVSIRQQSDIQHAPYQRQQALQKDWDGLNRGISGYKKERAISSRVAPMILVVAAEKQNAQSGKLRFSERVTSV